MGSSCPGPRSSGSLCPPPSSAPTWTGSSPVAWRASPVTRAELRAARRAGLPVRAGRLASTEAGCGVFCGDLGLRERGPRHDVPSLPAVRAGERAGICHERSWSGAGSNCRPSAFQATSNPRTHGRYAGQLMRSRPPASVDMHADCHPLSHPAGLGSWAAHKVGDAIAEADADPRAAAWRRGSLRRHRTAIGSRRAPGVPSSLWPNFCCGRPPRCCRTRSRARGPCEGGADDQAR